MALEGTVNIPVLGKAPKKELAIGAVVVAVLVGIYYYRRSHTAAAPVETSTAPPVDTGAPGGEPGTPGSETPPSGPPFANNSAWSNWAIQQMGSNDPNLNIGHLTTALGLYLNGQPLDAAQRRLVFSARGIAGDPPVAGPGGYPPKLKSLPSNPPPGGPGKPGAVTGLHASAVAGGAHLTWHKAARAEKYHVRVWHSVKDAPVVRDVTVPGTAFAVTGLARHSRYGWHVQAENRAGHSAWSATHHFETK